MFVLIDNIYDSCRSRHESVIAGSSVRSSEDLRRNLTATYEAAELRQTLGCGANTQKILLDVNTRNIFHLFIYIYIYI